jgi:hypothetical protein
MGTRPGAGGGLSGGQGCLVNEDGIMQEEYPAIHTNDYPPYQRLYMEPGSNRKSCLVYVLLALARIFFLGMVVGGFIVGVSIWFGG